MGRGINLENSNQDKRLNKRATFKIDIFYPHINNKIEVHPKRDDQPVIRTINISETGICFLSRIELKKADFISFLIRIEDYPSFECFGEVKWLETKDENFIVGCQFYTLSSVYQNVIREYINKVEKLEKTDRKI